MSKTVTYQGYTITSAPAQDTKTGQWRLHISISWEGDGRTQARPYWMPITYPTEQEADFHGISFGQRIVDGKIPGISLRGSDDTQHSS